MHTELSYDQSPLLLDEAVQQPPSPLDLLIQLEEELGCSIVEALRRYRQQNRTTLTLKRH